MNGTYPPLATTNGMARIQITIESAELPPRIRNYKASYRLGLEWPENRSSWARSSIEHQIGHERHERPRTLPRSDSMDSLCQVLAVETQTFGPDELAGSLLYPFPAISLGQGDLEFFHSHRDLAAIRVMLVRKSRVELFGRVPLAKILAPMAVRPSPVTAVLPLEQTHPMEFARPPTVTVTATQTTFAMWASPFSPTRSTPKMHGPAELPPALREPDSVASDEELDSTATMEPRTASPQPMTRRTVVGPSVLRATEPVRSGAPKAGPESAETMAELRQAYSDVQAKATQLRSMIALYQKELAALEGVGGQLDAVIASLDSGADVL
ncbi:hypothetical protein J8273_0993 [Carpediemonas membranifera]|uniref:Uncharacterized protein n=1 Tax=Carpediemonas membranifera TaxID=201153 RepID=A0A8J6B163_9EUKA|nr:hypothetical protein J8273_0993 [Carpediemonas membranifera]|eukprot:KAG9397085.1 hypothetical protein J8273_0993 [Carpediemonas membranifera]